MRTRFFLLPALLIAMLGIAAPALAEDSVEVQPPRGAVEFSYQLLEPGKLLISAADSQGEPIRGLTAEDFVVSADGKQAKILSVETLETDKEVELNIVLVVDNSSSMRQRKAVEPLLTAMDGVFQLVRPIDEVHLIVFDDDRTASFGGRDLHVRMMRSSDPAELRTFLADAFGAGLTDKTVLYEAMLAGIELIRRMPEEVMKFLVVFSDGEDINSAVDAKLLMEAAGAMSNCEAYAVDYMPGSGKDPFLQSFAEANGGRLWKASAASDLVPIFQAVSSKLLYRYVVGYKFLYPPSAALAVEPQSITVEEITTLDSSPMLAHVYFDTGSSKIPERYVRFKSQAATLAFNEHKLRGAVEKYHHLINIIGKRMTDHPLSRIRLVGCNANTGAERGRKDLSRLRAEAIKAYLQYIWGIDPVRIQVEARNLPQAPSTSRLEEGQAENRRVEIYSEDPALLDVIRSLYVEAGMDTRELVLRPSVDARHGVDQWNIRVAADGETLTMLQGRDVPAEDYRVALGTIMPARMAAFEQIAATMELRDREGHTLQVTAEPVDIRFIRKKELMAQNLGYRVEEKYALILFDFDSAEIKERNQLIVDRIVERIRSLPQTTVEIVGHTDIIGKEDYNLELSERRAKAVYEQLVTTFGEGVRERISYSGKGPFDPLYDNELPEGRALNRTVTITLEYETRSQ